MHLLDTDHLSLLERGGPASLPLQSRLERIPAAEIATTIITYEEQMRGWLARVAQARTLERLITAYARLQVHLETFRGIPVVPFEQHAAAQFERLRQTRVRIGTMDLKIAAVAQANDATLPADLLIYPGHIAFAIGSPVTSGSKVAYALAQAEASVYGVTYGKTRSDTPTQRIRLTDSTLLNPH